MFWYCPTNLIWLVHFQLVWIYTSLEATPLERYVREEFSEKNDELMEKLLTGAVGTILGNRIPHTTSMNKGRSQLSSIIVLPLCFRIHGDENKQLMFPPPQGSPPLDSPSRWTMISQSMNQNKFSSLKLMPIKYLVIAIKNITNTTNNLFYGPYLNGLF